MSGFGALEKARLASAFSEGLVVRDLPVEVGSGLGTRGEDTSRVGNLVAGHAYGALHLDLIPSEVVPGAGVLPVGDVSELLRPGLLLKDIGVEVAAHKNRHVYLLQSQVVSLNSI